MPGIHDDDEMVLKDQPAFHVGAGQPLVEHREQKIELAAIERRQQFGNRAAADGELEQRPGLGDALDHARHDLVENSRSRRNPEREL